MNHQEFNAEIQKILHKYKANIESELRSRWNNWDIDINEKEKYEVLGGLLCRQVIIMIHFADSPAMWNPDLAHIIHRSQIDNFFNIAWIAMDPLDRSRKYIHYGLGAEKLNMANRKKQIEDDEGDPTKDPLLNWSKGWSDSQRYTFLTEVNFGSWTGISTRKMAEESGNIGLYNYSFQPFSSVAHNMWNHIGKMCMKQSDNSLHKLLHVPHVTKYPPSLDMVDIGAKYLDRAFKTVDDVFPTELKIESSWDIFNDELDELMNKYNEEE